MFPGREVVEAVTRADANDESTWIEWKSTLDLGEGSAHHHIAKHVLGFADRPVQTAALHADGHAYLVVGAEPGSVAGVDPVDPAVLRSRILRYVGTGPRWRAEFVPVQDRTVLVVIADPPDHGDTIHPVRNPLGAHPKGRILIRHAGSTDPADADEIDHLVARARAGAGRLLVAVQPRLPAIEMIPEFPAWAEPRRSHPMDGLGYPLVRRTTLVRRDDARGPAHPVKGVLDG